MNSIELAFRVQSQSYIDEIIIQVQDRRIAYEYWYGSWRYSGDGVPHCGADGGVASVKRWGINVGSVETVGAGGNYNILRIK
jgi:hypothetical protein